MTVTIAQMISAEVTWSLITQGKSVGAVIGGRMILVGGTSAAPFPTE